MSEPKIVLQWPYTPLDFFEEPITVTHKDYTLTFANGKAEATIAPAVFDGTPSMRDELTKEVTARFLAVQLSSRKPFTIETARTIRVSVDADGKSHISVGIELGSDALNISGHAPDIRITDRNGKVVTDSRRDRIDRQTRFADLVSAHVNDELLRRLLASNNKSIVDADNELVHLYEIRDALQTRFGGERAAMDALGISKPTWKRFGQLCNDEPLKQGRHRGRTDRSDLRDATHDELDEARAFSRSLIEAYLRLLNAGRG